MIFQYFARPSYIRKDLMLSLLADKLRFSIRSHKKDFLFPAAKNFKSDVRAVFCFIFYFTSMLWQPCRGRWKIIRSLIDGFYRLMIF